MPAGSERPALVAPLHTGGTSRRAPRVLLGTQHPPAVIWAERRDLSPRYGSTRVASSHSCTDRVGGPHRVAREYCGPSRVPLHFWASRPPGTIGTCPPGQIRSGPGGGALLHRSWPSARPASDRVDLESFLETAPLSVRPHHLSGSSVSHSPAYGIGWQRFSMARSGLGLNPRLAPLARNLRGPRRARPGECAFGGVDS